MKRILIMALVLLLCAGLGACAALADESGQCGENLTWTLTDSGAFTISGTGPMYDYDGGTNLSPFDGNE